MRERLAALKRLCAIYGMVEEMQSLEARRAYTAVLEAQSAILAAQARTYEARTAGRDALLMEDRMSWSLAGMSEDIADRRRKQLEPLMEKREETREQTQLRYLMSRLSRERMNVLIDTASAQIAVKEERQAQAREDDRFLARRAWMKGNLRNIGRER